MAEMSMNKAIHGAFRRDLDRFVAALSSFPAGDQSRADGLAAAWENFDDQLTHHHTGEHEIAWSHLEKLGVSREVLQAMDGEHDAMAAALTEGRTAMADLRRTPDAAHAQAALAALQKLQAVTVQHMDHEESEIEQVYLTKQDTPEMKAMGKAFAKVSPARGGRFFAWMLDGATPEERATVTSNVPGPVLKILTATFGRGYNRNVAPVWRG